MWREPEGRRYAIALELTDPDLREALTEALGSHAALALAPPGVPADAVILDGPEPPADGTPALRLDGGPLPPGAPAELILAAAHLIAAGLRVEPAAAPAPSTTLPRLSPREREVLALMVDGAPNKSIARALGISVRTAKFHVAAVLGKLGARNRAEAVAIALREGLIVF
jgi:DNA-binding CsgD family transcriptional regulator